jgi:hypothetical protein
MKPFRLWKPIIISLIATPICLFLAMLSGGGGHGNYFLAKILFPFTMLSTIFFDSITFPFVLLAILQFPLYGLIYGMAKMKSGKTFVIFPLFIFHLLVVTFCFIFVSENFS